jgi:hypothetical protein
MYRPLGLPGNRNYLSCLSGFVIDLRGQVAAIKNKRKDRVKVYTPEE